MKLPYRLGDSFAMPLGNGHFARSCIVQCEHRVVVVRVFLSEESWLDLRVSDDALVLARWKRDGSVDARRIAEPRPENPYWMHAARAERIAAAAFGAPHPRERKIHVRELRDDNAAIALASLDDDCIVTLTQPVSDDALDSVRAAVFNHPGIMLRLAGGATSQLGSLSNVPMTRLSLGGPVDHMPTIASLRYLDLAHADRLGAVAEAFPGVESLRISQRDVNVRLRDLNRLRNLRALDLSLVHLPDATQFSQLSRLETLRLSRVTGVHTADVLASLALRNLALEDLYQLQRVDGVVHIATLEQLELVRLWQFEIAQVESTLDCKRLVRAEIDIGGRRKNVELYRRANWAYPWRF